VALKLKEYRSGFDRGPALADFLPYDSHDDGLFILKDGSLGMMWSLATITEEGLSEEERNRVRVAIEGVVMRVPAELACQIILVSSSRIEPILQNFLSIGNLADSMTKLFLDSRMEVIREAARNGFPGTGGEFRPRILSIYFTIRHFLGWQKPGLADSIFSVLVRPGLLKNSYETSYKRGRERFGRLARFVEGILGGAGFGPKPVSPQELISVLYPILNPIRATKLGEPIYQPTETISEQVALSTMSVLPQGLKCEGMETRVISLEQSPEATFPGMISELLRMNGNYLMTINFHVPSKEKEMQFLKLKGALAFTHRFNVLGDISIESQAVKRDIDETTERMFTGATRTVLFNLHIARQGEPEELESRVSETLDRLHGLGCEGVVEDLIGDSLTLASLPFGYDPANDRFVRRERRWPSDNFSDALPVFGDWRGTVRPVFLYFSRRGAPIAFDLFDNEAPHAVISGATGAGKSVLVNDMIAQALRLDPMIFIIDKGGSYERICELFGGQYFTVDLDHPIAVNPFAGDLTREKQALLTTLIVAMATRNDEREHLDAENVGVIEEALVKLYRRLKDREIQLSDLTEVLVKDYGERGKGLRQRLFAFTREGQFGMFFDRPNELKAHSSFNVFDLKRLDGYPELQASFLLVTMNFIISSIQSTDQGRPKYLFIDEAWALLKNEASARYVAEAFRTYRKLGCAVVAVSQAVSDFLAVPGGKTILQNAPIKILLRQERETVSTLKEELKLSPEEVQLVSSVTTVPGVRSEFYLRTSWGSGVGILYLSPIMYWVTTTDFRDIERYRRKLTEFSGNQTETIKALAREDIRRKAI
jgi:conjugal transfer ATP-binding protein TraC